MSELTALAVSEGYGACVDELLVHSLSLGNGLLLSHGGPVVGPKSSPLRFRLAAKTASAPLLLLFKPQTLRWFTV